jgi:hypothetical protein
MLSLVFMSNESIKSHQDNTAIAADTCDSHKEVVIIDNHPYMIVNGTQHPIIELQNRKSFHNHFEYFYSLGLNPTIKEYHIPDDTDPIILECNGKYYY